MRLTQRPLHWREALLSRKRLSLLPASAKPFCLNMGGFFHCRSLPPSGRFLHPQFSGPWLGGIQGRLCRMTSLPTSHWASWPPSGFSSGYLLPAPACLPCLGALESRHPERQMPSWEPVQVTGKGGQLGRQQHVFVVCPSPALEHPLGEAAGCVHSAHRRAFSPLS